LTACPCERALHIFREQVKIGRTADHSKWESGWVAAYDPAKKP